MHSSALGWMGVLYYVDDGLTINFWETQILLGLYIQCHQIGGLNFIHYLAQRRYLGKMHGQDVRERSVMRHGSSKHQS